MYHAQSPSSCFFRHRRSVSLRLCIVLRGKERREHGRNRCYAQDMYLLHGRKDYLRSEIGIRRIGMVVPAVLAMVTMVAVPTQSMVVAMRLRLCLGAVTAVVLGSHTAAGNSRHERCQQTQTIFEPQLVCHFYEIRCKTACFA